MIVLDASAALEMLLRTNAAAFLEERVFDARESLHAPHLLDVEVVQVVRRYVARGVVETGRGGEMIDDLLAFPIQRYPHDVLLSRVYELRDNLTAYDAVYVALAEALDAPLVTRDARLARSPGHQAQVELF